MAQPLPAIEGRGGAAHCFLADFKVDSVGGYSPTFFFDEVAG